jgi:hypothetical protein
VGYKESFTTVEWLSLPISILGIYRWEGQGWAVILGPALVVLVLGSLSLVWAQRRAGRALTVFQLTSAVSGLFILSWAAIVVFQMARALSTGGWQPTVVATMVFAGSSVAMGLYALLPAFRGPPVPDPGRRAGMVVVGVIALLLYSGLYVGPVLAFVSALLPEAMAARSLPRAGMVEVASAHVH